MEIWRDVSNTDCGRPGDYPARRTLSVGCERVTVLRTVWESVVIRKILSRYPSAESPFGDRSHCSGGPEKPHQLRRRQEVLGWLDSVCCLRPRIGNTADDSLSAVQPPGGSSVGECLGIPLMDAAGPASRLVPPSRGGGGV